MIAYNGKRSGGFAKRDEVSLFAMGREFAAAMNLCQEEAKHEASISLRNAQIDKCQQDVAFLAKMTRKLQLALDLKDSFIVAHRQLRKLCRWHRHDNISVAPKPPQSQYDSGRKALKY